MMSFLFLSMLFFPKNVVCQGSYPTGGEFNFNGYLNGYLYTDGTANLDSNSLISLTNSSSTRIMPLTAGQVFYNFQLRFKDSVNGNVYSFSTTFIFTLVSRYGDISSNGLAFALSPKKGLSNVYSMGDPDNQIVAVELKTVQSGRLDVTNIHVGIDINGSQSEMAALAGYFEDDGTLKNHSITSGDLMQVWIEYDSKQRDLNVTLHSIRIPKPKIPTLSLQEDISPYFHEFMYVGFISATGTTSASHYVLGWTFKINGTAPNIDPSRLPEFPRFKKPWNQSLNGVLTIILTISGVIILIVLSLGLWLFLNRKKLLEVIEDWEVQFGTKGFNNTELLGRGGFGKVYKGTLPVSNIDIAIKVVSHDSRQGMREFIAEIATIGRLRHPNLVRLQGYCRHKGELYLVYDCMPKGSLDKFLYHHKTRNLDWSERFKIIKDVASGLCYLHQEWVQVIIHRDIKPANVLLDGSMNAKLGDFGLAKLCDHGIDPQTSHVAGTLGYISPELSRTGKASTRSDVFALGVVMLEISCGRKPILSRASQSEMVGSPGNLTVLTDWVLECWETGDIMQVLDHKIRQDHIEDQVALVLKLGLLCSHLVAAMRPSMSSVIEFLDNVAQLPLNLLDIMKSREINSGTEISGEAADSPESCSVAPLTFTEPFVSRGR